MRKNEFFQNGKRRKIKKKTVGILDLKSSNSGAIRSIVEKSFPEFDIKMVSSIQHFDDADNLILPGVGQIKSVANEIDALNIRIAIKNFALSNRNILGICLGLQLLGTTSEEEKTVSCLGLLDYKTETMVSQKGYPVPHVGWNTVSIKQDSPLTTGIAKVTDFYFSHSFAVVESEEMLATTRYSTNFVSIVARQNIYGVQFHPEKSQKDGLSLLSNFIRL